MDNVFVFHYWMFLRNVEKEWRKLVKLIDSTKLFSILLPEQLLKIQLMKVTQLKPTLIALLVFGLSSQAQLKFPVTNNDLRNNLSEVLTDYVQGFSLLKGDTIAMNPQSI